MILKIELDNADSEILNHLVTALNEPELTAEQCATNLLTGVLARIWAELFDDDQLIN